MAGKNNKMALQSGNNNTYKIHTSKIPSPQSQPHPPPPPGVPIPAIPKTTHTHILFRAKYYIHCTRNYILLLQLMIIIEHV